MRGWQRILIRIIHRIWFRAALFSAFSIGLALLAAFIAPVIPYEISVTIGSKAVDNILGILASSMLAVTTFSLATMVQAFTAATSNITPRATQLLVDDSLAQNALSTFLGAFLFAIVGICALSTGLYGGSGRVILFAGTLFVIIVIVLTLLRWIEHLSKFGRVDDTISRVEKVATRAARLLAHKPHLGAGAASSHPAGATAVYPAEIGYITHVDVPRLHELADDAGLAIHVAAMPGTFATLDRPLGWIEGGAGDEALAGVRRAFAIEDDRDFVQDARFGLVVLSEIGSRALSPGINDPGTAIAVIGAGVRVLAELMRAEPEPGVDHPRVHLPSLSLADLVEDLFRPLARDGAGNIEVAVRIQKALASLAGMAPEARPAMRERADDSLARACEAMASPADRKEIEALHARLW